MTKADVKINLPGGIVSIGDLQNILLGAEQASATFIRLGNRQQLYFEAGEEQLEDVEHQFFVSDTSYEINTNDHPNIISSYVSEDIFDSTGWLREGVYKDILDSFSFTPKLKINLVDSSQTFIPFFTGNINFISAEISNYWYLYVRFPKTNHVYCWSTLIYSEDISDVSKQLERTILENTTLFYDTDVADGQLLEAKVSPLIGSVRQDPPSALQLPAFQMPAYEGFNMYGDRYWLGIYRRDERFPVAFLKDLCVMCSQSRIGQIYTTPWKSMLIKGISSSDVERWKLLLKKYRINTRHGATELNWQTEDLCDAGLELKLALVREFDQEDLAAPDLCFAVKMNPKAGLFGSVIIRRTSAKNLPEETERFDILHTADFNPNSKRFFNYRENVPADALAKILMELCCHYSDQTAPALTSFDEGPENPMDNEVISTVLQCRFCLSIYDEEAEDDRCALCEADKSTFFEIEEHKIYV